MASADEDYPMEFDGDEEIDENDAWCVLVVDYSP